MDTVGLDGFPLSLDDAGVDDIQGSEVLLGVGAADGVVIPVALGDQGAWRPDR